MTGTHLFTVHIFVASLQSLVTQQSSHWPLQSTLPLGHAQALLPAEHSLPPVQAATHLVPQNKVFPLGQAQVPPMPVHSLPPVHVASPGQHLPAAMHVPLQSVGVAPAQAHCSPGRAQIFPAAAQLSGSSQQVPGAMHAVPQATVPSGHPHLPPGPEHF